MGSRSPWSYVALAVTIALSIPLGLLLIFAPASQTTQCSPTTPVSPGHGGSGLNETAGKAVALAAYDGGWRGDDLVEMTAVSYAESSWDAAASNGSYAGLWQLPIGTPNVFNAVANAQQAYAKWSAHLQATPSGAAGGPDPTPGSFTGNAPVIQDNETVDGGLPLNIPEEPWQDWPPSATYGAYETALAYLNANIGNWGLPAGWATNATSGGGGGGGATGTATNSTTTSTGTTPVAGCVGSTPVPITNGPTATIAANGIASAPADAPAAVKALIGAGNEIIDKPYPEPVDVHYDGGNLSEIWPAYDCSASVSFVLYEAGLRGVIATNSGGLMSWALPGAGTWVTVYATTGHTWIVVDGIALDTSNSYSPAYGGPVPMPAGSGPRWIPAKVAEAYELTVGEDAAQYVARHPPGL